MSFLLASSAFGQLSCWDAGAGPLDANSIASLEPGDSGPQCSTALIARGTQSLSLTYTVFFSNMTNAQPDSAMAVLVRVTVGGVVRFLDSRAASSIPYGPGECQNRTDHIGRVYVDCTKRVIQIIDVSQQTASAPVTVELYVNAIPRPVPRDDDTLYIEAVLAEPALQLRSGFGVGTGVNDPVPGGPGMETKSAGSTAIAASYPLGALFYLQLAKADGTPVPSQYTMGAQSIAPALTKPALFSDKVALKFGDNTAVPTTYFRAVHLGTAQMTITPQDGSTQPITVNITIVRPSSLGSTQLVWDSLLTEYGHVRGIPPAFLKGQAEQESNFNPRAYRYEPLAHDLQYFSLKGLGYVQKPTYSDYRLAPDGPRLKRPDDVDPRNRYCVPAGSGLRRIQSTDVVSLYDIFTSSDRDVRCRPFSNWGADNPADAKQVRDFPDEYRFPAQTTLASSYGLFQMTYLAAISELDWKGVGGGKNPSLLFDDDPTLIAAGGGSTPLAAEKLQRTYNRLNLPSQPSSPGAFLESFKRALQKYNGGGKRARKYKDDVIEKALSYAPRMVGQIFQ